MLVLSRRLDERVMIDDRLVVTVTEIRRDWVRLGFEAPADVQIFREELYEARRRRDGLPCAECYRLAANPGVLRRCPACGRSPGRPEGGGA